MAMTTEKKAQATRTAKVFLTKLARVPSLKEQSNISINISDSLWQGASR